MPDQKSKNMDNNSDQEKDLDYTEKSLKKLLEEARTKSEAYKKILKSLNTNKNRD